MRVSGKFVAMTVMLALGFAVYATSVGQSEMSPNPLEDPQAWFAARQAAFNAARSEAAAQPGIVVIATEIAALAGPPWTVLSVEVKEYRAKGRINQTWLVKRATAVRDEQASVSWADGRTCPQIEEVLTKLRAIAAPKIQFPALESWDDKVSRLESAGPSPAGAESTLWLLGLADGQVTYMKFSQKAGLVANWRVDAEKRLSPCWTDSEPS